jgi:hypothetical protein
MKGITNERKRDLVGMVNDLIYLNNFDEDQIEDLVMNNENYKDKFNMKEKRFIQKYLYQIEEMI